MTDCLYAYSDIVCELALPSAISITTLMFLWICNYELMRDFVKAFFVGLWKSNDEDGKHKFKENLMRSLKIISMKTAMRN
ncbi:CLUMA_CG013669, isoform A [Clunio marinus]|uniref:CLUMA_CG013669, isoform A n=1 Tax=Clunio marinus TaxID=568069 RepID=A0A1J1IKV7_9DIPT|nr:CLUMA_CG013669, isoform A [Clunio marinus]